MSMSNANNQNENSTSVDDSPSINYSPPPPDNPHSVNNSPPSPDNPASIDELLNDILNTNQSLDIGTSLSNVTSDIREGFDIEKENIGIIQNKLIPQLVENENQKRDLKYKMVNIITGCLIAQGLILFVPMTAIIYVSFSPILKDNNNLNNNLSEILSFLKYFISAVIVETLTMLYYIIKKVFDSSITDMIELFKKNKKNKKDKKNSENSS